MRKLLLFLMLCLGGVALVSDSALAAEKPKTSPTPSPSPSVASSHKEESKPAPQPKIHVVEAGDSLSIIAEKEELESWRPLWDANEGLANPDLIYAGQQLVVPTGPVPERPLPEGVAPVQQTVVRKGTTTTTPRATSTNRSAANYAPGASGVLERIRMRESGGNYAINTGNGYYGAYQFSLSTWRGVGGAGLPSEASPAEQDMRAQMLYDRRGCSPWPNTCY